MILLLYFMFALLLWPVIFRLLIHLVCGPSGHVDNEDIGYGAFYSFLVVIFWPISLIAFLCFLGWRYVVGPLLIRLLPKGVKYRPRS